MAKALQKASSKSKANSESSVRLVYFNQTERGLNDMARSSALLKEDDIPKVVSAKKIRAEHLKKITPMTQTQETFFDQYDQGYCIMAHGMAGVGKTFLALYCAIREVLSRESEYDHVVVVRSATPVKDVGFLPGSLEEKIDVYQQPYRAIFNELFPKVEMPTDKLAEQGIYKFVPTSFIRGITLHRSIVVFDEASSASFHELDSVITRLGSDCKIIICGDKTQSDLIKKEDKEGFPKFMSILKHIPEFRHIEFFEDDVVRGPLVKQYLITKHSMGL